MVLNATEYLVQHGFRIVLTILPAYLHHKEWQSFICTARTSTFWWNFIVWLCCLASLQLIHVHAAQSVCTVNKSLQILHCLGFSETRWSLWCALFFAIILDICSLLRCFVPNLSSTLNSWLSYYNAANFQKDSSNEASSPTDTSANSGGTSPTHSPQAMKSSNELNEAKN